MIPGFTRHTVKHVCITSCLTGLITCFFCHCRCLTSSSVMHGIGPLRKGCPLGVTICLHVVAGVIVFSPESRGSTWDVIRGGFGPDVEYINAALDQVWHIILKFGTKFNNPLAKTRSTHRALNPWEEMSSHQDSMTHVV